MENPYLSVIIPAYNEEKRISNTLLDIDRYLTKQDYSYEIIVVNDGSPDKTAQIVKNFINLIKNLKLIDNQENGSNQSINRFFFEVGFFTASVRRRGFKSCVRSCSRHSFNWQNH